MCLHVCVCMCVRHALCPSFPLRFQRGGGRLLLCHRDGPSVRGLRQRPPLTTAMIILASVLSSTVSNVVLGEEPAFTVPEYELKSAAGEAL